MIHVYCRVSSQEQIAGTSLDDQERLCRAAALVRGCEDPRVWRDEGVSGSLPIIQRAAGNEMLSALEPGDLVITAKLDRIFRSATDALTTAEQLRAVNVDLILLDYGTEPIMGSICGRLFFVMLAGFAQFERERIRERILDGKRAKKERGGRIGGQTPYGYSLVRNGKNSHLEPYEPELALIHRARVLYGAGWSWQRIAESLNGDGYRTRNDTPFQARQIGRWLSRPAAPEEATAKLTPPS